MSSADPRISTCRNCQHYQLQGRRGGLCQKLNVGVQGNWAACPLAIAAFDPPVDLISLDLPQLVVSSQVVSPATPKIQNDIVPIDTSIDAAIGFTHDRYS